MGVTIKDVAREAQVSVATVSRALNGQNNVAETVRKRVRSVADRLQYTPHHAARSLSSRKTRTIGVVLPELYGEFFSELIYGIDQVAREHDLHLLVSSYHGDPVEQGAALRSMRGRVDGMLVMSPYADADGSLGQALAASVGSVLINPRNPAAVPRSAGIDNHGGARAMVEHLAGAGHRSIAFISGPDDNFDAGERLRGYLEAMDDVMPDARPRVLAGDFSEASGQRAGRELLEAGPMPQAVFAANDMMALGCMFALMQAGLVVPQAVAVAGFDDIPLARYVHPSLTTMRVDMAKLGADSMRLLLRDPGDGQLLHLQRTPQLIVRESCGGARASPDSS